MSNHMKRFDEGYEAGREAGFDEGFEAANQEEHDEAFLSGYLAGVGAPDNEHFAAGYKAGAADTKRLPQATYQEGYDDGYAAGTEDGFASAE